MITHAQRPGLASAPAPVRWFAALRRLLGRVGLLLTLFCLLFPIYWLVQSSLSTQLELFHTPAYFFPPHPTLAGPVNMTGPAPVSPTTHYNPKIRCGGT